jgi:hypothetical protein
LDANESNYRNALASVSKVKTETAANNITRNRDTRLLWVSATILMVEGKITPTDVWTDWYKAKDKDGKEPTKNRTFDTRVAEIAIVRDAAKKDGRLLACWPEMGNDNKPTLSLAAYKEIANAINAGSTESAEQLVNRIYNAAATYEGAVAALSKRGEKLLKDFPAQSREIRELLQKITNHARDLAADEEKAAA